MQALARATPETCCPPPLPGTGGAARGPGAGAVAGFAVALALLAALAVGAAVWLLRRRGARRARGGDAAATVGLVRVGRGGAATAPVALERRWRGRFEPGATAPMHAALGRFGAADGGGGGGGTSSAGLRRGLDDRAATWTGVALRRVAELGRTEASGTFRPPSPAPDAAPSHMSAATEAPYVSPADANPETAWMFPNIVGTGPSAMEASAPREASKKKPRPRDTALAVRWTPLGGRGGGYSAVTTDDDRVSTGAHLAPSSHWPRRAACLWTQCQADHPRAIHQPLYVLTTKGYDHKTPIRTAFLG